MRKKKENKMLLFILCLCLGHLGAHRFYLKRYTSAVLMLMTAGGLGLWYITDMVLIATGKLKAYEKTRRVKQLATT